jgi:hypothetical protein
VSLTPFAVRSVSLVSCVPLVSLAPSPYVSRNVNLKFECRVAQVPAVVTSCLESRACRSAFPARLLVLLYPREHPVL